MKLSEFSFSERDRKQLSKLLFKATQEKTPSLNVVKMLITAGADTNIQIQGHCGFTPIMNAAGSPEIVRVLLASGADVNAMNDGNLSALYFAIQENSEVSVKLLLHAGAKVNFHSKNYGYTPLIRAAGVGAATSKPIPSEDILRLLISAGADLEAKNNVGQTALFMATAFNLKKKQQILIDAGANVV